MSDFVSPSQLAEILGCSTTSLARARSRGEGPPWVSLNKRCIRYRRSDVDKWLADRTHVAGESPIEDADDHDLVEDGGGK